MAKLSINRNFFIILTVLGAIGVAAILPYELSMFDVTELPPNVDEISTRTFITINFLSKMFLVVGSIFLGMLMMDRTKLGAPILQAIADQEKDLPKISPRWFFLAISVSFIGTAVISLLDIYVFMPQISSGEPIVQVSEWWHSLSAILYGGIVEEIMLRFFVMALIVWLLAVVFRREANELPQIFYWIGIFGAAILFGLGHLPATAQLFGGLNNMLILRAIILNGMLGVWFGYLFYRKGLEYAIIAHMAANLFLHVLFIPLFT